MGPLAILYEPYLARCLSRPDELDAHKLLHDNNLHENINLSHLLDYIVFHVLEKGLRARIYKLIPRMVRSSQWYIQLYQRH